MKQIYIGLTILALFVFLGGECQQEAESDKLDRLRQEQITSDLSRQIGVPAIVHGREKKIVKDMYELRDQEGLITYTYTYAEQTGRMRFLGITIGYPIPYATQFSNPQKIGYGSNSRTPVVIAQAEPNGLFSPAAAEGTWILMWDSTAKRTLPVYVEPRVICFPFKLPDNSPLLGQ